MRTTSRPASCPASRVAWRWVSLKYAGTVMTAFPTGRPNSASATSRSFLRIIAEISCGRKLCGPSLTVVSSPILRFTERAVRSGAITAWLRAALPTKSRPSSARPTTLGRIGSPSTSSTRGRPSSTMATSLLVVPRSMPTITSVGILGLARSGMALVTAAAGGTGRVFYGAGGGGGPEWGPTAPPVDAVLPPPPQGGRGQESPPDPHLRRPQQRPVQPVPPPHLGHHHPGHRSGSATASTASIVSGS